MKKGIIFIYLCILSVLQINAQVETRYFNKEKASESIRQLKEWNYKTIKAHQLPSLDKELLKKAEDDNKRGAFHWGESIEISYSLSDGVWQNVSDGRLWILTIESSDASSMSFVFNKLYLSEGAFLYIINEDETVLYGPVTNRSVAEGRDFITNTILGKHISILLYEPYSQQGKSILKIKEVVIGLREQDIYVSKSINTSTDCSLDVACKLGWDLEADATGIVLSGGYGGSGALLMTTDNSFKGYFLTAKHVVDHSNSYTVTFFYRRKTCGEESEYSTITCNNVVLRASWSDSDMALLEILDLPTSNPKLAWLGWDRTGAVSHGGVSIHYPHLKLANIAVEYDNFSTYKNNFWRVNWDESTTKPGSSGSPLLNQSRRVVGQDYGSLGGSGLEECDVVDMIYGKFSKSWTGGGTNTSRLSNWLDPSNTGVTVTNSRRRHASVLVGPTYICSGSTGSYSINDLPSGCNVSWSWTNGFGPTPPNIQVSGTTCTINNNVSSSYIGTLNAKIYYYGTLIETLQQRVIAYSGFYGLYDYGNVTNQQFFPNSPIWVTKGTAVHLKSPNLVNKNVSYSLTNPSAWQFISDTGVLHVTYPNVSTNNPILISVQNNPPYSNCDNSYQLIIMPNSVLPGYSLSTIVGGNGQIVVSLVEKEYSDEVRSVLETCGNKMTMIDTWTLEVYNANTGKKVFGKITSGMSYAIETTGWTSGVYVVKAVLGEDVLSEKVMVK